MYISVLCSWSNLSSMHFLRAFDFSILLCRCCLFLLLFLLWFMFVVRNYIRVWVWKIGCFSWIVKESWCRGAMSLSSAEHFGFFPWFKISKLSMERSWMENCFQNAWYGINSEFSSLINYFRYPSQSSILSLSQLLLISSSLILLCIISMLESGPVFIVSML